MSDAFYWTFLTLSRVAFASSGRPIIMGRENVPRSGPVLLAANHVSWYDIPLLAEHCPRHVDFLAIAELYEHPLSAWFYRGMNGIRYDRSKPDTHAVREMLERLAHGRLVAIFPEGKLCKYEESVFTELPLRPGMSRIAIAAQAPILPVVLWNTDVYRKIRAWMPVRRARYGMCFGPPLTPPRVTRAADRPEAIRQFDTEYRARMRDLRKELLKAMPAGVVSGS